VSARRSDTTKEIVLALIARARPCARIETMLSDVVLAYGVIARMLQEVEEQEYARLRELGPPVLDRRRRAEPYRVEGTEALPRPRMPGVGAPRDREEPGRRPELVGRLKNGRKAGL